MVEEGAGVGRRQALQHATHARDAVGDVELRAVAAHVGPFGPNGPSLFTQPASRTNNAGTTATFSVLASGMPYPSYQWRKDEVALADGGNITGATTRALSLSNVVKGDEGSYSVVVSNALGSVTSLVATLTVNEPLLLAQPASRTNNAGTIASFSVLAGGTALS